MTPLHTVILCALIMLAVALGAVTWRIWRRLRHHRWEFNHIRQEMNRLEQDVVSLRHSTTVSHARLATASSPNRLPIRCCSQHGEELLLWNLLDHKLDGYYIEVGAHDGVSLSNSYFFESIGWRGLLVEAHPELAEACRDARPGSTVVHAALGATDLEETICFSMVRGADGVDALSFSIATEAHKARVLREGGTIVEVNVPVATLSRLLETENPPTVDFISIDVEGAELDILRGTNLGRWQPRVLIIEDNSGGVDTRVAEFVRRFGYRWIARCGCNDYYSLSQPSESPIAASGLESIAN